MNNKLVYSWGKNVLIYIIGLGLIYLSSLYSFLLFHTLIEMITIIIGSMIFILAWHARQRLDNQYLLFVGLTFLFTGAIDLTHTLGYKGIGIFTEFDANLPTQLWIIARALQSVSLLIAPIYLHRKLKIFPILSGFMIITTGLMASVFLGIFPDCYIEGEGLTRFKIIAEYVISGIFLISTIFVYRHRSHFDKRITTWIIFSFLCLIASELMFTSYISIYGSTNAAGHYFKLIAYIFIYKAMVQTGFEEPQQLYFRQLQESEKKFRALINSSPVPMVVSSEISQDTVFLNQKFTETFGYTIEDIPNIKNWFEAAYPDPAYRKQISDLWNERATEAIRTKSTIKPVEAIIRTKSGEQKNIITHLSSIGKNNLVVLLDDTDQKLAMEKLQQSEQDFRSLIQSIPVPLSVINDNQKTNYLNPKFTETFGYELEEIPDTETWFQLAFPDSAYHAKMNTLWQEQTDRIKIKNGEAKPVEVEFTCKNGEKRILECHLTYISGKMMMLYVDVTERKQMADILQEERTSLARKVKQSTQDLRLANQELARTARLKDEFLSSMSHELRTPLNSILALSEVMQEEVFGPVNPRQEKYLRTIQESGYQLLDLINDILDISKMEAGEISLNDDWIDIEQLCASSLKFIEKSAVNKSIHIKTQYDPQAVNLVADYRRLKQVLINLLKNAVKFTPEGGTIGLDVKGSPQSATIDFVIWDTGIGIAQEDLDQLFTPFSQLDGALSRKYEGTGLGLALVQRLVALHKGSIKVTSQVNDGSRFVITLPWNNQPPADLIPDNNL